MIIRSMKALVMVHSELDFPIRKGFYRGLRSLCCCHFNFRQCGLQYHTPSVLKYKVFKQF
jgi:hypothetical protein